MSARLRLRRADGEVFLDRWGVEHKRLGGVFLHRMDAPDPGVDLHDHPWWFVSIIIAGGYLEERAPIRLALDWAVLDDLDHRDPCRGHEVDRRRWSIKALRLDEAHSIKALHGRRSWSLVVHGPTRRGWGFYTPDGWLPWRRYEQTEHGSRRGAVCDISSNDDGLTRPRWKDPST